MLAAGVTNFSCLTFSLQQDLAALLIDRVELGRGGIARINWTFSGVLPVWIRMKAAEWYARTRFALCKIKSKTQTFFKSQYHKGV